MNWTQISKRGRLSVLPNIYSMEAVTTITNQLLNTVCYKKVLIALENRNMHVFVDTESINNIQEKGLLEIRKNPKIFDRTIQEIQILAKEWLHWLKILNPENKTNKELIEIYLKYREYYKEIYGRYFTILVLENPLTAHLHSIVEKAPEDKRAEYFTTLTSTIEAMHSKREERDRLQLAVKIKKYNTKNFLENPEINAWIEHHTEKYFWLTRDYEDPHLTKEDFIKKIHESLERADFESAAHHAVHEEEEHQKKIHAVETELKLSKEEKEFFRIMRAGIFLKELRKNIVSESLIYFDKVLEEICKRTDLTIELARMLLPHDLPELLLENKPYTEILQKRFNKSVYLIQDGKYIAYTGKEAEKWFNELIKVDQNIREIQGIPASAGIASGPARIVLHPNDFHKVKEGDIMITVQAVPSFLQTIKKCRALVADGGTGITSHPATLAREAKIPCVINAKIATEIIQDGDHVEVDGNKGIIKRVIVCAEKTEDKDTGDNVYNNLICVNDEPDMNLFSLGIVLQGMHRNAMKQRVGFSIGPVTCEYINKRIIYRVPKKNYHEFGRKAFEKIQQDKNIIKKFFEEIKQCNKNVHEIKTTDKKEIFDIICENLAQACMLGYFTVAIELENQLLTNKVYEIINTATKRACSERNPQEYFTVLTTTEQESASGEEYKAILKLVKDIQTKKITKKEVEKELEKIHKTYCWSTHGYNGPAKSKETYIKMLDEALEKDAQQELKKIEDEKQELKTKEKQFLEELKLSKEESHFIECLKATTATKILRKDLMAYTSYLLFTLFEDKRKEHNLTIDELQFITPHEARILLAVNKVPSKKELQQRVKHCLYLYNDPEESFLYGEDAEKFLKEHIIEEKVEHVSELKGMAVYLGKVQGRVVIINTKEDMYKIKEGDILVSYATSPEILPAMKKAAAIVTDHGGATCHAAIVAREMKKPCIIGTKIATKVLKDGDFIEVDAAKGIIQKIEADYSTKEHNKSEEYWIQNAEDDNVSLYPIYNWWLAAYHKMPEEAGVQLTEGAVELKKNRFYWLCKMPEWKNVGEQLTEKTIADKKHFPRLKQRLLAYVKELNEYGEEIAKKDVASMTAVELNTEYQRITCAIQNVWGAGVPLVLYDFDYTHLSNKLIEILEKKTQNVQETLSILTTPHEETAVKKEEDALMWIIEAAQKKGKEHPDVKKALHVHYEQYKWINYSWNGPDAQYSFFEDKLNEKINQDSKEERQKKEKQKQEALQKRKRLENELRLNEEEKRLFEIGRDIVFLKAHRKEYLFKVLSHIEPLLNEIAKQCNMSIDELRFLLHDEVAEALLKNKDFTKIAKERKKHCIVTIDKGKVRILIQNDIDKFLKNVKKEEIDTAQKEIKGTCANSGYAEGKVHIVNCPEDMKDFEEGSILVSVATNPMIVSAMKKAGAIITDEGGLTCHASIVSRELGKPCIIGTKYASKILKNNEQIIVDASKGVITRKFHDNKSQYIAWFSEINNKDVALVGGKCASLGEMYNIMPVPNGFCITVDAYKEALNSILPEINHILKNDVENIEDLEKREQTIKEKIAKIQIPTHIEKEIRKNYKKLSGKVAVRSSATTEDLADASFAGQQDSYLNVDGEHAVLEAVKKCWASLFNARAIQYREEKGFKHDDAYLAVVIQKMVDAEKAGVIFTANPVNNSLNEMIIEACFGLGEKLVSGEITPDSFIVNKTDETVAEHLNNEKRTLEKEELNALTKLAKKIEQHYGRPMDIEWAIEKGEAYILQARPITTLKTEKGSDKWTTNFSIENCGSQLLHPALRDAFSHAMVILFGSQKDIKQFLAILEGIHLKKACVKEIEIDRFVKAIIEKILKEPETIKKIHKETYVYNEEYFHVAKKYRTTNFLKMSDKKLAETYRNLLNAQNKAHGHSLATTWFLDSYQEKFSKLLMEKVKEICKNSSKDVAETFSILTTLPKNSLALQEEIESLKVVQKIQQSNEKEIILDWKNTAQMPECSLKKEMEAHYQKWCWMPFSYLGPAYDREFYLEVWRGLVKENFNAEKRIQELQQRPDIIKKQQEALIQELKIGKETKTLLEIGADIAFLKGYRKDVMYHGMYALSFILKEAAKRLHVPCNDMYLLTDREIYDALMNEKPIDSAALYERKGKHCFVFDYEKETVQEYRGKQAEEFLKTQEFIVEETLATNILKGTTACSGYAKGIVKIINHPTDMPKMEAGNILIAHTTMPSLLPAMKKAAAIVTEDGGITCHAAIVSRELKIPCITGIKTATKVLKDGMVVEVNASEGVVKIS